MNLIERVKNIFIDPKKEWNIINSEDESTQKVITSYVLPLSLIPAVASFIGEGLMGDEKNIPFGIVQAGIMVVSTIMGILISCYVVYTLAPNFNSEKNFDKAGQLISYAYTPSLIGGIFAIYPPLSFISLLFSIYAIYVLYLGFKPMMKTPEEKVIGYCVVSILVVLVVMMVILGILGALVGFAGIAPVGMPGLSR